MAQLSKVLKLCAGPAASLFPPVSLQRQVVCSLLQPVFMCSNISGKSLHCFLVGWYTNKSYVIATSGLWLFIHASNLLPLNSPSPLPYKTWRLRAGLEVEESHTDRQTVERSCRGALGSVAELSCTEAVRGNLTTELTYTDG